MTGRLVTAQDAAFDRIKALVLDGPQSRRSRRRTAMAKQKTNSTPERRIMTTARGRVPNGSRAAPGAMGRVEG